MDLLEEYLRKKKIRYERKDMDGGEQIIAYSKNGDRLMKPKTGTVHFLGETKDVPICPECDHMLLPYVFDDEQSEMVTYCKHCGQMIDWSEWKA